MTFRVLVLLLAVAPPAFAAEAQIAFGTQHAVALRTNGDVLTWGDNVQCQLGRTSTTNRDAVPTIMMRNAKEIAAASFHTLVLTTAGKVYGWGMNPEGALGMGHAHDLCEGPELVPSLADKIVVHLATGYGFSVAVTSTGDLYCAGDNSMGQCPAAKGGRSDSFVLMTNPEIAGKVVDVKAGMFHALALTKDAKLFAFGRGRDGQLGNGRSTGAAGVVADLTDVVSFAAGTWHSVAARADGTVWAWGNNSKSQLCDSTTTNRAVPTKVDLPGQAKVTRVAAGGHATAMTTSDGAVFACGDNPSTMLALDAPVVPQPAKLPLSGATAASLFTLNGAIAAWSPDGCAVRLAGADNNAIVSTAPNPPKGFALRPNLTLCGTASATPLPDIVNPAPKGGASGCWTPRVESDASTSTKYAGMRQALLTAEGQLRQNAAFLAAPVPVRFRTGLSIGPDDDSGAMMHIKVVPERKQDSIRIWTGDCDVIPQIDRIGGPIGQVSIFMNVDARVDFIGPNGAPPKLTGRVAGYPEYNGWVLITKDGRVPWIPQTLDEKLNAEGERRQRALDDWRKEIAGKPVPANVAAHYAATTAEFEKQIKDYQQYRASFTAEQLKLAAVPGDPTGEGKRKLDADLAALHALTPAEQQQIDDLGQRSRALERQAQVEAVTNKNAAEAARLRAQANDLANQVRAIRQDHLDRISPLLTDAQALYTLSNLKPGPADKAISVKRDPAFPDSREPNRVQLITVMFSADPDPKDAARREWWQKAKAAFDYAALAALIK